jgi:hypothetical protein
MKFGWNTTGSVRGARALLTILSVTWLWAQPPQPSLSLQGSVTGRLVDGETKLPLCFAEILLVPNPAQSNLAGTENEPDTSNPPKPHLVQVLGLTSLDGTFRMNGVPAGDYLAGALMPGYVIPGSLADANASAEDLKHLLASLPAVHVAAGQVASVKLSLHRGGVIAGRVRFADGSPMIGASVAWELAEKNLAIKSVRLASASPLLETVRRFEYYTSHDRRIATDDTGNYRVFGLPPGNYIVSTILFSQFGSTAQVLLSNGSSLEPARRPSPYPEMTVIYLPGVFRRSDARIFQIRGSTQVMNADLKVNTAGLHAVKGRLFAGEDRHVPSRATVRLSENGGKDVGKFVAVEEDGSFQFDYLLPGNYTLELLTAVDEVPPPEANQLPQISHQYKMQKFAVVVGSRDVVLDDILLTELKPGEKVEFPE